MIPSEGLIFSAIHYKTFGQVFILIFGMICRPIMVFAKSECAYENFLKAHGKPGPTLGCREL